MAVRVKVESETALREELVATITLFAELVSRIERGDLRALHGDLARWNIVVGEVPGRTEEVHPATGRPHAAQEKQALIGFRSLLQLFEARRELLEEDTITAPHVAELLGVSRQTPLNRVRERTLLGVLDRGAWRFPLWQFDADAPAGVLPGLTGVLQALEPQPPFAKLVWLRRPNPTLDGHEPIELLRKGEASRVVDAARAVAQLP